VRVTSGDRQRSLLLVSSVLEPGGVSCYLIELAQWLRSVGHTVGLLTSDHAHLPHWSSHLEEAGVEVECVERLGRQSVRRAIRRIDAEAVKLFTGAFPPDTRLTSQLLGVPTPIVESLHAWPRRRRVKLGQQAFFRLRPDRHYRVVVFSRWMEAQVAAALPSVRRRLRMLPMGMWLPDAEREFHHAEDIRFVSVGRLDEQHKNFTALLHAFAALRSTIPSVSLTIVGDGPDAPALRDLAAELGIIDAVDFRGWRDEPIEELRQMDIFVLSTHNESFGRVLIEAASVGLPVISSDVGGASDAVGENGMLVQPDDVDALTDAMRTLAADTALREAMGAAGMAHATRFDMHQHGPALLRIVDEAIG
jgi:glycosyltransferase involved in cell wall biosynthesis